MTTQPPGKPVLVTGGTGFLGTHCILHLLQAGYRVRTTVRDLKRKDEVHAMLRATGMDAGNRLSFVTADLLADQGWPEAVADCDYVLHDGGYQANMPSQRTALIQIHPATTALCP